MKKRSLFDSPEVMRGVVEIAGGAIIHVCCNEAAAKMYGVDRESISGKSASELGASEEVVQAWVGLYEKSRRTGNPVSMEYARRTAGGQERWLLATAAFLGNVHSGNPRFAYTILDLTDRKRAEEALRVSEERLRLTLDGTGLGTYEYRPETGECLWDAGARAAWGLSADAEVAFPQILERIHPEDLPRVRAAMEAALQPGSPETSEAEYRVIWPDGSVHWILGRSRTFFAGEGDRRHAVKMIGVHQDITARKQAEEVLRTLSDNLPDGAIYRYRLDAGGQPHVDFISAGIERLTGATAAEYLADAAAVERYIAPEDHARLHAAIAFSRERLTRFDIELRHIHRETGETRWSLLRSTPRRCPDGSVAWDGIEIDITERKRAEEALRESEERFRALVMASSDVVYRMNPDWSEMRQLRGRDFIADTETPSRTWLHEYIHPDDQPRVLAAIGEAIRSKSIFQLENRVLRVDGSLGWTFSRAIPMQDANGEIVEWLGAASDITARKRAEMEIARQARLLGQTCEPIFAWNLDGTINYWNNAAETLYGFSREEAMGRFPHELLRTEDPIGMPQLDTTLASAGSWMGDLLQTAKDGRRILMETAMTVVADPDGRRVVLETGRDITERKRAGEALAASESRFRALLDSASQGVVAVDAGGRMVLVNARTEEMFGYTRGELLGQPLDVLLPERYRTAHGLHLGRYFAHPHSRVLGLGIDLCGLSKTGSEFPLEISLSSIEQGGSRLAMAMVTDITERKKTEERLRQAQKLESLGLLAGGVAHDFNNLLVGVIGNASLAQEMLPPGHPAGELLDQILRTGEQAAHLTRQMLAYSGKGRFVVEPLDLSALIPEMTGLVRPSIPKKIALLLDLDPSLPALEADRGQVQQVFMNLAINAAEAIGSHDGLISVRTCVENVDEPYLLLHSEVAALRPGKYVCLEVRDTGSGMDEATKARIFDPFFTTKFTGRGLGLAAVAGIMRGHKGAVTVSSAVGKGSCFTVLFPAVESAVRESPVAARNEAVHGAGVVLVVDDEPLVRKMAQKALERHGYTVLLADSGLAAMDVFARHTGEIALVVLDLSMPNMDGAEALPELRKVRPGVEVIVSSGYSEGETMTLFHGQRVSGFIQKPYTAKGLAEKVKSCIG